jgi:signal transduction histidine kinase
MSPLEILKLVGFATGAALHLYIAWLIWNRKLGSRQSLTQPENAFLVLGLCLGMWFLGNLLTTLHVLLLTANMLTVGLRVWDTITMSAISVLPAALLHAHVAFWSSVDNYRFLKPQHVKLARVALHVPLIALPYAIDRIWSGDYRPFLLDLRPLLIPYSVWFLFALWSSAAIDWAMKDRSGAWGPRERLFFKRLAVILFIIGALEFVVIVVLRSGPDSSAYVFYVFLSLLPTFTIAYHVYRYKLVEVLIKGSLVYAGFAILFFAFYTYVVRYVDRLLVDKSVVRPGVIEAILLLGMVALAGPVVRVLERAVRRLFAREVGLYRDVVRQVSSGAAGFGELDALLRYTEQVIRQGLELSGVRIVALGQSMTAAEERLARKIADWQVDVIEHDEDLTQIGAAAAYALKREDELIGLMILSGDLRTVTSEKRAILDVLAGQVAVEIETCRLVEEKVRLERELASRERLATLGQMAATVAHEVKNPLSSIKSIAQVMREDAGLAEYDRDLELIVSEIDRLNRTVSQLLAFSRPSNADPGPVPLAELVDSTVGLLGNEARDRGVKVSAEVACDVTLDGAHAAALREALSNLIVNAIQASSSGGEVIVEAGIATDIVSVAHSSPGAASNRARVEVKAGYPSPGTHRTLVLSVTDQGSGIPEEKRHRIFEPFYTTKARGTGLGLAIVQRRVAELGGLVEVTSPTADNHGTRFRLVVPCSSSSAMSD